MDEHLGYGKHDVAGRGSENSRNGTRTKTVMTEIGPVEMVLVIVGHASGKFHSAARISRHRLFEERLFHHRGGHHGH